MRLELLAQIPASRSRAAAVLFVHGAFSAAWCWEEHFLPHFARHGYAAYALSLRGHGNSEGADHVFSHSMSDYVKDLTWAVDEIGTAPVLVGHSMGGMVIQRYLDRARAPAAVLMASVPPSGLFWPSLELAWRDPSIFGELGLIQYINPRLATLEGVRRVLFSPEAPLAVVAKTYARMQPESHRAIYEMTWPQLMLRRPNGLPPLLVLGAERDAFFGPDSVRATAEHFGVRAEIFPAMAHAMMLEPGWQTVADRIIGWLTGAGM
jgi:pimeloyl-ACP methyl ester carboxylesterase